MNPIIYLSIMCFAVALAGIVDNLWLRYVRPILAVSYNWPEVDSDEHIPPLAWIGAVAVLTVITVFFAHVGAAVGF